MKPIDIVDRRLFPRARGLGLTATVLARNNQSSQFGVEDLSAGGARLVGDLPLTTGERIQVLVGRAGSKPMALAAQVVRVLPSEESGRQVVAVSFSNLPDPMQDAIQGLVLRALERQRAERRPSVLVIDDMVDICRALARDMKSIGYSAVTVRTPLDAVRCLQDPGIEIDAALVDLCLGQADGLDVIAYLVDEHPQIRRVVMSGKHVEVLQREVTSGRADAYVVKPWDRTDLTNALRR